METQADSVVIKRRNHLLAKRIYVLSNAFEVQQNHINLIISFVNRWHCAKLSEISAHNYYELPSVTNN